MQWKPVEIMLIQRRIKLPANAVGTAQIAWSGKQDVGKIVGLEHRYAAGCRIACWVRWRGIRADKSTGRSNKCCFTAGA